MYVSLDPPPLPRVSMGLVQCVCKTTHFPTPCSPRCMQVRPGAWSAPIIWSPSITHFWTYYPITFILIRTTIFDDFTSPGLPKPKPIIICLAGILWQRKKWNDRPKPQKWQTKFILKRKLNWKTNLIKLMILSFWPSFARKVNEKSFLLVCIFHTKWCLKSQSCI